MIPSESHLGLADPPTQTPRRAETTGRYIVVFADEESDPAGILRSAAGVSEVADSRDLRGAAEAAGVATVESTVFAELGMAVVSADADHIGSLQTSTAKPGAVLSVWPELVHHVLPDPTSSYVEGYRDGVSDLAGRLTTERVGSRATGPSSFGDDAQATWGLHAVGALSSDQSGAGVKVAVLDTGFDETHPDFAGRSITAQSFVQGEPPHDGHGHGTHCIGTSCGPRSPASSRRYGVAYEADIFSGKVLSNAGSGSDGGILMGIDWAVANECAVVSMSLGADVPEPHPPYTAAGRRALSRGSLIVAAAGNNAGRPGDPGFVGAPANSPHVLAVAALGQLLTVAPFSARSLPGRGGQVDLAGPGVAVYSSWPMPQRYHTISGTSMATPHVAGLAALWAQRTGFRGRDLWCVLAQYAQRLAEPSVDIGGGLVLAPQ